MTTGLLNPVLIAFVFAPLGVGLAIFYTKLQSRPDRGGNGPRDTVASALSWIVSLMPHDRADWGVAMVSELAVIPGMLARWRFALGCARVALFPPPVEGKPAPNERSPILGLLAVALPPFGLPFIYGAAVVFDILNFSPFTQSELAEPHLLVAVVKVLLIATVACLVAGLPLGLAGRCRRERLPRLSVWGIASSTVLLGYFLIGMQLLAGGE